VDVLWLEFAEIDTCNSLAVNYEEDAVSEEEIRENCVGMFTFDDGIDGVGDSLNALQTLNLIDNSRCRGVVRESAVENKRGDVAEWPPDEASRRKKSVAAIPRTKTMRMLMKRPPIPLLFCWVPADVLPDEQAAVLLSDGLDSIESDLNSHLDSRSMVARSLYFRSALVTSLKIWGEDDFGVDLSGRCVLDAKSRDIEIVSKVGVPRRRLCGKNKGKQASNHTGTHYVHKEYR